MSHERRKRREAKRAEEGRERRERLHVAMNQIVWGGDALMQNQQAYQFYRPIMDYLAEPVQWVIHNSQGDPQEPQE